MFEITTSQAQGKIPVTVLHLSGDLDANGADQFAAAAQAVIEAGAADVLLDMSKLSFMSSIGMRALHTLFYALHPQGSEEHSRILKEGVRDGSYKAPHMKLLNPSPGVTKALETAGMDLYFAIFSGDAQPAIASFG